MFVFHKHQTNSNVASFDHILSCERDSTTRKVIFWIYYMFQPNQKTSFIDFQLWQLMLKKKSDVTKCITRTIRPVQIQVEIMDHNICVRGDSVVDLSWSVESVFFSMSSHTNRLFYFGSRVLLYQSMKSSNVELVTPSVLLHFTSLLLVIMEYRRRM